MSADLWKEIFWPLAFLWERPEIIPPILVGILDWWVLTIIFWDKSIQRFLDKRLRPKGKKRKYQTSPGERLHTAFFKNFETTVLWEFPGQIFRYLALALGGGLAIMTIAPVVVLMVDPLRGLEADPLMIVGFWFWIGLVTLIGVPQTYHFRRWEQRNWRAIEFSKQLGLGNPQATVRALFHLGEAYLFSWTDPRYIEELKIASRPEQLDPRFSTPTLRDWWTEFWAREPRGEALSLRRKVLRKIFFFIPEGKDVASIYLPARAVGGEDYFTYVENASDFMEAKPKIRQYINLLSTAEGYYMNTAVAISDQAYGQQKNAGEAEKAFETQWGRGEDRLSLWAEPREWDLFDDITETVISAEGIGAKRPAPVADDEMVQRYTELFPEGETAPIEHSETDTPQESPEEPISFAELWKSLRRRQRRKLSKAKITRDLAGLIHDRTGETPQALLGMVEEGLGLTAILNRLGVLGRPSSEGRKTGTLPEGNPAQGFKRPKGPPDTPEQTSRFLREDDED